MEATSFPEENVILDAPFGMTSEECSPLPVWVGKTEDDVSLIISCWKVTQEELEEIKRTGRIWVIVHGSATPPIFPTGLTPFNK